MSNKIIFQICGNVHEITEGIHPDTSLNIYIRDHAHLKGTKNMCFEGVCGSCIVVVRKLHPFTKNYVTFSVNSCLVPVFSCHGWNIVTIEGVGSSKNGFHKLQSTLAEYNGIQCGYCSPGMIMNMYGLLCKNPSVKQVEDSFGGNICRCTGYRPILDAFKSIVNNREVVDQLLDIEDLLISNLSKSRIYQNANLSTNGTKWYRATSIEDVYNIFKTSSIDESCMILAGNTGHGIYKDINDAKIYVDINQVSDLHEYHFEHENLILGANMSLSDTVELFYKISQEKEKFSYLKQLAEHIEQIGNVSIRNVGTLAGNISMKKQFPLFSSDIFVIFEAVRAQITLYSRRGIVYTTTLQNYILADRNETLILSFKLFSYDNNSYRLNTYRISIRAQNSRPYINAGIFIKFDKDFRIIEKPSLVFGGVSGTFIHATRTEIYLYGKKLLNENTLKAACNMLISEIVPVPEALLTSVSYRQRLCVSLLYKFTLNLSPESISSRNSSGGSLLERPISSGKQYFTTNESLWPLTKAIPEMDALIKCSGEAEYVNDIPIFPNELFASFVVSVKGPGKIISVEVTEALMTHGVVKFISSKDIPGINTYTYTSVENLKLFADEDIDFAGQVIGLIVAKSQQIADKAAKKVKVNINITRKPILNLVEMIESGDNSRIKMEVTKNATCQGNQKNHRIEDTITLKGQYHFTLETQVCLCVPSDEGIDVYPASQYISFIHANISAALAIPANDINIKVKRLGGAFGCKQNSSSLITTACAIAAYNLKVPVKITMSIETNMEIIGKRFPFIAKYKGFVNDIGKIQSLDVITYTDHGCAKTQPIVQKLIRSIGASYESSTWSISCHTVTTDMPLNCYCRGPGIVEANSLTEHIMEHIAVVTNQDPINVRLVNTFQKDTAAITSMVQYIKEVSDFEKRSIEIIEFNNRNRWKKKGMSVSFMNIEYVFLMMYHASISVYSLDGTVAITHGGIDMGQGLNTKIIQVCANELGIDINMIKVKSTNLITSPNDQASAASCASDSIAYAVIQCCKELLSRLKPITDKYADLSWKCLIKKAFESQVDLYTEYMFAPSKVPLSNYPIYGITVCEVIIDVLTGQREIIRVDLLEDVGRSINPLIDVGQVEGAFVMGLGYWMTEKLINNVNTGKLLTNNSWTYTPPGTKDIPADFRVYFRPNSSNPTGVLQSKITGEMSLCMSISFVFAIRNALRSSRKDAGFPEDWFEIPVPCTPEEIFLTSLTSVDQFTL